MIKRRKKPEHVNHERWLVSYADFITLLFAFFVVLFASGQADKKKQKDLARAMQTAFTQMGIFEASSKRPALSDAAGTASAAARPSPLGTPMPTEAIEAEAKAELEKERQLRERLIAKAISVGMKPGSVVLRTTAEGLVISLREYGFFASGSSQVRDEAMPMLVEVAKDLPQGSVRVEGHTDDVPIHTQQFPSNWELSSARAGAIARILLAYGKVPPTQMAAQGLAEFHPVSSNATEAGRTQNRRVDVVILRSNRPAGTTMAADGTTAIR